jgi:hypothetical protein
LPVFSCMPRDYPSRIDYRNSKRSIAHRLWLRDGVGTTDGGGLGNSSSGTLTVTSSTFDHNSATGGGGGGGICAFGGKLDVTNTIVAHSTNGDCVAEGGIAVDGGHNLIEDTAPNACGLTNGTNGNIIGQDPNLDPASLQNNGGPTQTIALLPGSPAIDAADPGVCAAPPVNGVDRRGFARLYGCDTGAFEVQKLPTPVASAAGLAGLVALLTGVGGFGTRWRAGL